MSLPARPIKLSFRIRRNFVSRDWTSIGLRGARATFRKAGTRSKLGSSGSDPNYMHTDESRIVGFAAPAANPLPNSSAPRRDWRGLLWTALIVIAIAAAVAFRVMQ
jgi:hypothetical protein